MENGGCRSVSLIKRDTNNLGLLLEVGKDTEINNVEVVKNE